MIHLIAGLPGAGKSYLLAYKAQKAMKRRRVFTSHPMRGTKQLTEEMLQEGIFPEGSLLVVDEANVWFNSRSWKDRSAEVLKYFAQHRHDGSDIILGTQNPARVDVVLRELCNYFTWITGYGFPPMSFVVDGENEEGEEIKYRVWKKRIQVLRLETVSEYEHWGLMKKKTEEEIPGYKSQIHLVRRWVFKRYNSWDMSQLADREEVIGTRWTERQWNPNYGREDLLPGGRWLWNYPEVDDKQLEVVKEVAD